MAKNKINDLRNHLFEVIEMLKDPDNTDSDKAMTVGKAKAIANISQVIINSAKLELDYVKASEKSLSNDFSKPEFLRLDEPKSESIKDK